MFHGVEFIVFYIVEFSGPIDFGSFQYICSMIMQLAK